MFKLRLNNYRGFLNEEFVFSRINILIGENSAGKSSIFKFLLALKQSMLSPNNKDYNLTLSGEETDLGNYYETIYNHEINRNLSFEFEFGKEFYDFFINDTFPKPEVENDIKRVDRKRWEIDSYIEGVKNSLTLMRFEVCNDLSNHNNIIFEVSNSSLGSVKIKFPQKENIDDQNIYLIDENPQCEIIFDSKYYNKTFNLTEVIYDKQAFLSIISSDSLRENIAKKSGLADDKDCDKLFWNIGYLLMAQNNLQNILRQIEYVNPLLHKTAERVYIESDRKNSRKLKNIKDLIDLLDTPTARFSFENKLTNLLKEFGIADSFKIKKEGFTRELRVKIKNLENNIKDVGFGVSLQIPIFAQAILSENTIIRKNGSEISKGEILFIEQPEVHLHPRLQAKFIDSLLSIGNNNFYFIETHSEHIIRMLQVIVKNGKFGINSESISIQYFKKDEGNMRTSYHLINEETGKLKPNFPKGFYDVSYDLAFKLMD